MEEKDKDMNLAEENQEFSFETNENVIEESEVSVNDEEVIVVTEAENAPEEETKGAKRAWKSFKHGAKKTGSTLWRWTKRTVLGASKDLVSENKFGVEDIVSPTKQTVQNFFHKPLAVIALVIFIAIFLFALIGPLANKLDLGYNESYHVNIKPGYTFMKVPKDLQNNVKSISSFSYFSVGLDNDGKLYVWGNTKIPSSSENIDLKNIPDEVKNSKIAFAAAGYDHIIAITESGKVIGWGEYEGGQYGDKGSLIGTSQVIAMPNALMNGTINVNDVAQLVCGYQVSAIVMKNGSVYVWGNYKSGATNLKTLRSRYDVAEVQFLGTKCVALLKDGTVWFGNAEESLGVVEITEADGSLSIKKLSEYQNGRKAVQIAATKSAVATLLEDGELVITGVFNTNSENSVAKPTLSEGETILQIEGGAKHFSMLTSNGNIYSFGDNNLKQCKVPKKTFGSDTKLVACAFQNYVIGSDSKIEAKWGCKGYLMGTDELGRNVFLRIMHGGKQTMTIGAVAVIISTVIAVIIGCLSGYFGGWVDMLLMRVTEIFGAIPFLPFALILSSILAGKNIEESTRIFMIMCILGVLSWTGLARMVRGQILATRENEYVTAAKAMGVREGRIAFKHILPNVISVILVSVTLDFAGCMLTESSLSYLGFGVKLPRPTWGNMLDGCNSELVIGQFWWRWFFPALFLLLTTICINIIGDALRDVMDPKSNGER